MIGEEYTSRTINRENTPRGTQTLTKSNAAEVAAAARLIGRALSERLGRHDLEANLERLAKAADLATGAEPVPDARFVAEADRLEELAKRDPARWREAADEAKRKADASAVLMKCLATPMHIAMPSPDGPDRTEALGKAVESARISGNEFWLAKAEEDLRSEIIRGIYRAGGTRIALR